MSGETAPFQANAQSRPAVPAPRAIEALISAAKFSDCSAAVIGCGVMGKQYIAALQALGFGGIGVCSRSAQSLQSLSASRFTSVVVGGYRNYAVRPAGRAIAIIAVPTDQLVAAAEHMLGCGFRRLLIEKPVSLRSSAIDRLADLCERHGAQAYAAYNRIAYPSFLEIRRRVESEGGATSAAYTFTEFIGRIDVRSHPPEELARWGIANSLHVVSMAHGFIGWPQNWQAHRSGALPWHPSGSVFVGSGLTEIGIPFSFNADWGSTGRWSVEVHTAVSSYRLAPLEKAFRRSSVTGDWQELKFGIFAPQVKAGLVEEVAAAMDPDVGVLVPLVTLRRAAVLTRFGENIFGYG